MNKLINYFFEEDEWEVYKPYIKLLIKVASIYIPLTILISVGL